MSLRSQFLLISVGLIAVIAVAVDSIFDTWNLVGPELLLLAAYAACYWLLIGILLNPLQKISAQTGEYLAGARAALAIKSNTSEIKALVENLEEILLRLQSGRKVMHRFLGDASHELRTPLTVISAYLQLLSDPESQKNPAYVAKAIDKMSVESGRMQRLIDDLLQLAEHGEGAPLGGSAQLDLTSLVRFEVENLVALQPERPVSANIADDVKVHGNEELLEQLLANLFANIRRHTAASAKVELDLVAGASWVTLVVNDAGPGLSDEAYENGIQHFQRYDQSRSRDTGGSGLGMSIMASIVERHGGQLTISKSVLGGLCTRITLAA